MTEEEEEIIRKRFSNWSNIELCKSWMDEGFDQSDEIILNYDAMTGDHSRFILSDLETPYPIINKKLDEMENKHGVVLIAVWGSCIPIAHRIYGFKDIMSFLDTSEHKLLRWGHYPEKERVSEVKYMPIPRSRSVNLLTRIQNCINQLHEKGIMEANTIKLQIDDITFFYRIELTPLGFPILKIDSEIIPPVFWRKPEEILMLLNKFLRSGRPFTENYNSTNLNLYLKFLIT